MTFSLPKSGPVLARLIAVSALLAANQAFFEQPALGKAAAATDGSDGKIRPDLELVEDRTKNSDKVNFVQDGEFSKILRIPTYEWIPKGQQPKVILVAVHGLTLHGTTFQVLGRTFAQDDTYVIATDMRGFGRCYTDEAGVFGTGKESKRKVDYKASVQDYCELLKLLAKKYPELPIVLMGESLGCTIAAHVGAEIPELVSGLILSAPAVRVNPLMYGLPANIGAGLAGIFLHPRRGMNMNNFFEVLVSNDPQVVEEAIADPLIRKHLTIAELLKTDTEIAKTLKYARRLPEDIPVLILQGSDDRCVVPRAVSRFTKNVRSTDQTVRWMYHYGHLLLETSHLRAGTIKAITDFSQSHQPAERARVAALEAAIKRNGGTVRN